MYKKRILCLDIGQARTGVAVSDLLRITAQGVEVIEMKSFEYMLDRVKELVKEYDAEKVIVGYPLNLDGSEGNKAKAIREQFEEIKKALNCPCELWDERLSTKQAERALEMENVHWKKKRKVIDKLAAQVILQSYLEVHEI